MKKILSGRNINYDMIITNNSPFYQVLHKKIYTVNDCVLLCQHASELDEWKNTSTADWTRMLEFHKDKTGYEWYHNELNVNDFINQEKYTENEKEKLLSIGFNILDGWGKTLKRLFPSDIFCLYLSVTEEYFFLNLRFHKYRNEEGYIWGELSEIDTIEQPVFVEVV